MKRTCRIWTRLSSEEFQSLNQKVRQTGLSRESYIRTVLADRVPKEAPPIEYTEMICELRRIGWNLNQIAKHINRYGLLDKGLYFDEVNKLRETEKQIQEAFFENNK